MHPSYDDPGPSTARTYRLLSLHTGPGFTIAAARTSAVAAQLTGARFGDGSS